MNLKRYYFYAKILIFCGIALNFMQLDGAQNPGGHWNEEWNSDTSRWENRMTMLDVNTQNPANPYVVPVALPYNGSNNQGNTLNNPFGPATLNAQVNPGIFQGWNDKNEIFYQPGSLSSRLELPEDIAQRLVPYCGRRQTKDQAGTVRFFEREFNLNAKKDLIQDAPLLQDPETGKIYANLNDAAIGRREKERQQQRHELERQQAEQRQKEQKRQAAEQRAIKKQQEQAAYEQKQENIRKANEIASQKNKAHAAAANQKYEAEKKARKEIDTAFQNNLSKRKQAALDALPKRGPAQRCKEVQKEAQEGKTKPQKPQGRVSGKTYPTPMLIDKDEPSVWDTCIDAGTQMVLKSIPSIGEAIGSELFKFPFTGASSQTPEYQPRRQSQAPSQTCFNHLNPNYSVSFISNPDHQDLSWLTHSHPGSHIQHNPIIQAPPAEKYKSPKPKKESSPKKKRSAPKDISSPRKKRFKKTTDQIDPIGIDLPLRTAHQFLLKSYALISRLNHTEKIPKTARNPMRCMLR